MLKIENIFLVFVYISEKKRPIKLKSGTLRLLETPNMIRVLGYLHIVEGSVGSFSGVVLL